MCGSFQQTLVGEERVTNLNESLRGRLPIQRIMTFLCVIQGSRNFFPLTSCKTDIRSHLGTIKVGQTTNFCEDGANMTICPAYRTGIGTFWRPQRKCVHLLHGNRKGKPERGRKDTGSSSEVTIDHPVCKIPQGWTLKTSRRPIRSTENTSKENLPGRGRDSEKSKCCRCV